MQMPSPEQELALAIIQRTITDALDLKDAQRANDARGWLVSPDARGWIGLITPRDRTVSEVQQEIVKQITSQRQRR